MVKIDLSDANPPASGEGFKFEKNAYILLDGADVVVTGSNKGSERRISVDDAAMDKAAIKIKLTLDNATIDNSKMKGGWTRGPLVIPGNTEVFLTLVGKNTLIGGWQQRGIYANWATLTIDGSGSLAATGAIGQSGILARNLIINDGNITAKGSSALTGILTVTINGGVINVTATDDATGICAKEIIINGGTVTAKSEDCAAINGDKITILGGTVHAESSGDGAAIGGTRPSVLGGGEHAGVITINGGNVTAVTTTKHKKAGAAIGGDKGTYKSGILIMEGDAVVFAKSIEHFGDKDEDKKSAGWVRLNTDGVKKGTLYIGNKDKPFFQA